jgi:hypothetical protein
MTLHPPKKTALFRRLKPQSAKDIPECPEIGNLPHPPVYLAKKRRERFAIFPVRAPKMARLLKWSSFVSTATNALVDILLALMSGHSARCSSGTNWQQHGITDTTDTTQGPLSFDCPVGL